MNEKAVEDKMSINVSEKVVIQVAVDTIRKRKNTEKVEVNMVERHLEDWIVRGTCPIDMEGHPWAEKFEVIVDPKGKVKTVDLSLL
jgi:hypothetical protein